MLDKTGIVASGSAAFGAVSSSESLMKVAHASSNEPGSKSTHGQPSIFPKKGRIKNASTLTFFARLRTSFITSTYSISGTIRYHL